MSYQKLILLGRLGKDPETRYTQGGDAVTSFSLATDEKWKRDGQAQQKTSWHQITCFKRTAEIAAEYLRKGSQVLIDGKIDYQQWEQDGVKKYRTVIIANSIQMVGSKAEPNSSSPEYVERGAPPLPADDFEDDIPF